MTRFLHTADLHIDSPLTGLAARDDRMLEKVQRATREALQRMVDLAIQQQVAVFLIAGDLFDGDWKDMRSGQWVAAQMRRLEQAGIQVVYLRGNHDAVSQIEQKVRWPKNVQELSVEQPETISLDDHGISIHGQGFADRSVPFDLAAQYPDKVPGHFNIGMLHTSLTGSELHATYAPTTLDVLKSKGYDYWALGHIHLRNHQPICADPYVTYSGNPQGRHIREPGEKGCLVVEVDGDRLVDVAFHPTDSLRWRELLISIENIEDEDALLSELARQLNTAHQAHQGKASAFRITLAGSGELHGKMSDPIQQGKLRLEIQNFADEIGDDVWLEKIKFRTQPPNLQRTDIETHDLWGAIQKQFADVRSERELHDELQKVLRPVMNKLAAQHISIDDDGDFEERLPQWVDAAQQLLRHRLGASSS